MKSLCLILSNKNFKKVRHTNSTTALPVDDKKPVTVIVGKFKVLPTCGVSIVTKQPQYSQLQRSSHAQ
jgi:hypothetical protein